MDGAKQWPAGGFTGRARLVKTQGGGPFHGDTLSARCWLFRFSANEGVFVVGGYRNVDAFDGILVGELVEGRLHFRGVVEWGYRAADVLTVLQHAKDFRLRTLPFMNVPKLRSAVWMEPRLWGEVSYAEVVEGRLRAPSWRGLVK